MIDAVEQTPITTTGQRMPQHLKRQMTGRTAAADQRAALTLLPARSALAAGRCHCSLAGRASIVQPAQSPGCARLASSS